MKFPNDIIPAHAIWMNIDNDKDEYADFFPDIKFVDGKEYTLRIVCDTDRAVYLDEKLISFGQYADYPQTPVYEDIVLPANSGSMLKITVWHSGIDSQTHVATDAYVAFCIYENENLVYSSSSETPTRPTPEYVQHKCKIITSQMGAGFSLNGRNTPEKSKNSCVKDIEISSLNKRPIKPLYLGKSIYCQTIREGMFRFTDSGDSAIMMRNAKTDIEKDTEGVYYLFDLGKECVGFPEISFESEKDCEVFIGWGEHIVDGMCRAAIHSRRFTAEIYAKEGYNHYFPVLRRFGLRYMQLFFSSSEIKSVSLRFHPVLLPADEIPLDLNDSNRNDIRATAIHTLRCCMHEHYEDCPWREQALYTLDSRNQMLAGYKVFENKNAEFVRANLDLISRGVRDDGILALCYPAGLDYPIPFYTLAYFMQMKEYIEHSGDTSLAREKYDILVSLLDVFFKHTDKQGLVKRFPDSKGYWNFYEWSDHLSGDKIHKDTKNEDLPCEAILNCALSIACSCMAYICSSICKKSETNAYLERSKAIAKAIADTFYNEETGLFFDFTDRPKLQPSVLTQAMCLLCGASDVLPKEKMLKVISDNGGENTVSATLSMACFRYDALLRESTEKYKDVILNEIDRDGKYMLDRGATTFWETLKGESDFGGAGSLCHGWSAMAAYYYAILL